MSIGKRFIQRPRESRQILGGYTAYNFQDKDPVIYAVRDLRKRRGMSYKDIEDAGGPKASTLWGWDYGATRSPRGQSTTAAFQAMGFRVAIIDEHRNVVKVLNADRVEPRLRPPGKKGNGRRH